jgi:hypothetical protein
MMALLAAGADPVVGATDGVHSWTRVDFGDTDDEICDAIIGEWLNSGGEPDIGDVWFARPHIYRGKLPPGTERPSGWPGYPGLVFERLDGSIVGTRDSSTGPKIDIIRSNDPDFPRGFKIKQNER